MAENVYFVSLGCPKNLVDSQVMLGALKGADYAVVKEPEGADVIVVNTCSFIEAAKEESIETILEMAQHKNSGRCKTLVVSGCLPQRHAKDLEKEIPEIDLLIGTGEYQRITELLKSREAALERKEIPHRTYVAQPAFIHTENDTRVQTGPTHSAFLKLSEGCNRRCSFCIIPKLRGNVRSRTVESLVTEARQLVSHGARELNLVAQDLTEYGMEWKYRERLETLLPALCAIDGLEWIRLHYVYPDQFSDELIEIIAREPKIVKYLDMPIQHTNDRVLNLMNRRLTREKLFSLVEKLRARIPGIVFRTSIIVGFPSETEEEFDQLVTDLVALDLDHVGVFRYSKEEGTRAAELGDQVHPSTKRRRAQRLIGELQKSALKKAEARIGTEAFVMIDGVEGDTGAFIEARLPTQAREIDGRVLINEWPEAKPVVPGALVKVRVHQATPHELIASAC